MDLVSLEPCQPGAGRDGGGRLVATSDLSSTRSPLPTAALTVTPGAIVARIAAISSDVRSGLPLIPSSRSCGSSPARAAGPSGATSTTTRRPGTSESSTVIPSQPVPAAAAAAGRGAGGVAASSVDENRRVAGGNSAADGGAAGTPGGGTTPSGFRKGIWSGSPTEISPGSKAGTGVGSVDGGAMISSSPTAGEQHRETPATQIHAARCHDRIIAYLECLTERSSGLQRDNPLARKRSIAEAESLCPRSTVPGNATH